MKRLLHAVGRRGAFLLFFALVDVVYGYSLLALTPEAARSSTIHFMSGIAPIAWWAGMFLVAALLCLVFAFRKADKVGFAAAVICKLLIGLMFLGGWLAGEVPRGYVSAAVWLGFAGLAYIVSTWPEYFLPAQRAEAE